MFRDKFKKVIEKYIATTFPSEASRAKGAITRIVNSSIEPNTLEQIQEVLEGFDELPEWIKNRFTPGSLYKEGGLVFGWYRENQVQAEVIPVDILLDGEGYLRVLAKGDGFAKAVPLPLGENITVSVPYEETFLYAKYGWANACPIQWYRNEEGYHVDRSIIPHGFWKGWKWWEGAWHWYIRNCPELFEDFECWNPAEQDCRQPKVGDVVLGDKNRDFWEQSKFFLD